MLSMILNPLLHLGGEKLRRQRLLMWRSLFFLLFLLLWSNSAKAISNAADTNPLRIGLFSLFETQRLTISIASGAKAVLKIGRLSDLSVSADDSIRIRKTNQQLDIAIIDLSGRVKASATAPEAEIAPLDTTTFTLSIPTKIDRRVRGNLLVSAHNRTSRNSLRVVLTTPLESLIASVIAAELSGERSREAFKTLAVVARSFILSHRLRHQDEGFDFCDTTHCQVYRGEDDLIAQTASPIRQAVTETEGEVLIFHGHAIEAYYTAVCGGRSVAPAAVWGGGAQATIITNRLPARGASLRRIETGYARPKLPPCWQRFHRQLD